MPLACISARILAGSDLVAPLGAKSLTEDSLQPATASAAISNSGCGQISASIGQYGRLSSPGGAAELVVAAAAP